ncbi:N-acetyl-gamma-glutamyl-phosphate reductase [bacterium]|nr:N-acetyl-gamma-glutamyl-phosphate reductase [bacterium]
METPEVIKVGIIGARAFTARELLRILLRHRRAKVVALQARVDAPEPLADTFPELRGYDLPPIEPIGVDSLPSDMDAVFLCLPHTVGAKFATELDAHPARVFDLSADFRFRDHEVYESVYGVSHPSPELNRKAVYGQPELNRAALVGKRLIAVPGCYPTSVLLALGPLMKKDMIHPRSVIADCKSGVSGAGRTPSDVTHYCNANEGFMAYKVAAHRHQPEIEQELSRLAGESVLVTFVPHLVPMDRGILATCYCRLKESIPEDSLRALFEQFYKDEPFVRVLPRDVLPNTKAVAHSNFCDVNLRIDPRNQGLIVISAIDNLVKGASGQAVQCMNVSFDIPETEGLF